MTEIAAIAENETVSDGERLHISGLFVGFITGLPQLIFPLFAAVFGVRSANNPILIPIVIMLVLLASLRSQVHAL